MAAYYNTSAITYHEPRLKTTGWCTPEINVKISFVSSVLPEILHAEYIRRMKEANEKAAAEALAAGKKIKETKTIDESNAFAGRTYKLFPTDIRPATISDKEKKQSTRDYKGLRFIGNYRVDEIGPLIVLLNKMYGYGYSDEELKKFQKQAGSGLTRVINKGRTDTSSEARNKVTSLCKGFQKMSMTYNPGPAVDPETGKLKPGSIFDEHMVFGEFSAQQASEIIYASSLIKKRSR